MDNVNDLLGLVVGTLISLLGGGVGADICRHPSTSAATKRGRGGEGTDVLSADGDLLAVGLICDAIDLLEIVRVGDDLITGDQIL